MLKQITSAHYIRVKVRYIGKIPSALWRDMFNTPGDAQTDITSTAGEYHQHCKDAQYKRETLLVLQDIFSTAEEYYQCIMGYHQH